jgi:hypothetical protein
VLRLRWLIPLTSLLLGTVNAQVPCDASRWGNASSWKGTFTVNGNGSGSIAGGCSTTYTATQSVTGTPTLTQGAFPNWFGTMNAQPSVNITLVSTCPPPGGSCTQTTVGNTEAPGVFDNIFLSIDSSSCSYSILPIPGVNATTTDSCGGGPVQHPYIWGPIFGPDGTVVEGLPANNLQNTGVIALPATGVDLSYTVPPYKDVPWPFAANWNINWKLSPKCQVQIPTPFGQGQQPWGSQQYGFDFGSTISQLGCALTSLTMALQFAHSNPNFSDPGALNTFMQNHQDFNGTRSVDWDAAVRDASNYTLKFDDLGGFRSSIFDPVGARQLLDEALCRQPAHPVIVGVKLNSLGMGGSPGHFVLVTGRDEDGNYTILDPATGTTGSLGTAYANEFSTRGIVRDPPGDISALDIGTGSNVSLLVTDAVGNRTGSDPATGNPLQEIPGSAYFVDRLDNDVTGAVDSNPSHMILIPTPKQGTFAIVAQGLNTGPYSVVIRGFSQDGSPQPPILINGNAVPGSATTYTINYASAPGANSAVNFSAFAAKAEIETGSHPGFQVRGSFTLGAGSSGITPNTQPVTLILGSFATTIPAGSFERHASGDYAFEGTINGVRLEFVIARVGVSSFTFKAEAHGVNLAATANPIPLELLIGSDGGTTQVTAEHD